MAQHRQCFYCKQTFPSAQFHAHLKQCPDRQKKNQAAAPLQGGAQYQQNPYGAPQMASGYNGGNYGGGMSGMNVNGGYGAYPNMPAQQASLWTCPTCSYQNSAAAAMCTMCQQSPRINSMQSAQQPQGGMYGAHGHGHGGGNGGGYNNGYGQQQQQQPQAQSQPPLQQQQQQQSMYGAHSGPPAQWKCVQCTFTNSVSEATCKICHQPQPNSQAQPGPPPPQQQQQPPQQMYGQQMYGGGGGGAPAGLPVPNKDDDAKQPPQQQQQGLPPPQQQQEAGPSSDPYGGIDPALYGGSLGAQDPDADTMALIAQLMNQSLCVVCKKQQGFELPCGHPVCGPCAKKYVLNGIATMKWKKQALSCPNPGGCKADGVIPVWVLKECGLGVGMQKKLEEMQNVYIQQSDPSITQCPKCQEMYSSESGDLSSVNANEKGPDGKPLSQLHVDHKRKYRFRCPKPGCKTVFCSGCSTAPYHLAYTCQEFKNYKESQKCRFCEKTLDASNMAERDPNLGPGLDNVCNSHECKEKRNWSCDRVLPCGHNCIGLRGHDCIPCLSPKCLPKNADLTDEEFCNICWVDPLRAAPCVKLGCKHYFHFLCLWQKIDRKWPAARITFGFLNCPLCKQQIHHPALEPVTKQYYDLYAEIEKDAIERVKIEGLQHDKKLTDPNSPYHNNLSKYAMDRLAFYPCSKCKKPYFGGMKACEEAGLEQAENYKQEHLVCGSCASGPNAKSCARHGKKYITYKCKFCCQVSSWYCWGSTHFCDSCHKRQEQGDYLNRKPLSELPQCPGPDKCPLGVDHPPNGAAEYSLGCVVCLKK
eukprot:CAMPEP_0202698210 /NCGR_PEP_ID=MMETSP1385-20130828/11478_1 /ASSEMBLY_ACC=CAM_ASM_000861 /TAXON_ID=933848 /ORGANISM="Elphidium margaritaceum" /LENGTH=810 /DNA_ID=CAMNT_0049354861 /DNA_START=95 /DNA_END=2527 /DNA_ORIENTATION=+